MCNFTIQVTVQGLAGLEKTDVQTDNLMSLNPALAHKAKEFRLKFYETATKLEEEQ